jgi:tRNA1(Val) A37 N6-methylase TrmN6
MKHYLKDAVDKLFVYKTPKKIIKYVEEHKFDFLIKNPPYEVRK